MTRRAAALAIIAAGSLAVAGPATMASAVGTPVTRAVNRLIEPTARWQHPGARMRAMVTGTEAAAAGFSGAELGGVSCTGRAQCTATGLVSTPSGKNTRTLAERWNGTKWVVQATPTPLSNGMVGGTLTAGVSCTSSHACVAAGYSYSKKVPRLLAEGWNGSKWTVQALNKQPFIAIPADISCTWAKDCMAVGLRASGTPLTEHWNGKKWSVLAAKGFGLLDSVSCTASRNCTAVGSNGTEKALAEHWDGTAWSKETTKQPMQYSDLNSVSCRTATDCVAVGSAGTANTSAAIAEQLTGSGWARIDPVAISGEAEFNSVSCATVSDCLAVGDVMNSAGTTDAAVAEHWDGTSWTVVTPATVPALSVLISVSCTSVTHCVAVGASSASATGTIHALVEVWNGTTWTQQTAPN
jgi:hypothetical protein